MQFLKRSSYIISKNGDANFSIIAIFVISAIFYLAMLRNIFKNISVKKVVAIFFKSGTGFILFATLIGFLNNGVSAILMFLQSYVWVLLLALVMARWPLTEKIHRTIRERRSGQKLVFYTIFCCLFFAVAVSMIQYTSQYSLEMDWFALSGTSLSYSGLTNFGTSTRLIGPFSGMLDFSFFILFSILLLARYSKRLLLGGILLVPIGSKSLMISFVISLFATYFKNLVTKNFLYLIITLSFGALYLVHEYYLSILWNLPAGFFSVGTLAPRLEMWAASINSITLFGSMGSNLSNVGFVKPLDSSFLFLATDCGLLFTFIFIFNILSAAVGYFKAGDTKASIFIMFFIFSMFTQVSVLMRFTILLYVYFLSPWGGIPSDTKGARR